MRRKHCLKELTIKDNFMFGAVMMDEKTLQGTFRKSAGDTDRSGGSQPGEEYRISSGIQRCPIGCLCER